MNAKYLTFNQEVEKHVVSGQDRARILALVVATAAAIRAPLPSSPVEDPSSHYRNVVALSLHSVLSAFNENVVLDLSYAMQQARVLWILRYNAAHPKPVMVFDQRCSLYENLSAVPMHVSDVDCEFSSKYKREIALLLPLACATIADANKVE